MYKQCGNNSLTNYAREGVLLSHNDATNRMTLDFRKLLHRLYVQTANVQSDTVYWVDPLQPQHSENVSP